MHHGYERPGGGYIEGDCYGVGWEPHETSPKLAEKLVAITASKIKGYEQALAELPQETVLLIDDPKDFGYRSMGRVVRPRRQIEVHREQQPWEFQRAYEEVERGYQRALQYQREKNADFRRLVETWQPLPLRSWAEEVRRVAEERRARSEEVQAERQERQQVKEQKKQALRERRTLALQRSILKQQRAIDRFFKKQDWWELSKLYSDLSWGSFHRNFDSHSDTVRALERDSVWEMFGLQNEDGTFEALPRSDVARAHFQQKAKELGWP